jgi:hypothetical protein
VCNSLQEVDTGHERAKRWVIAPLYLRSGYAWASPVNVTMPRQGLEFFHPRAPIDEVTAEQNANIDRLLADISL